MYPFLVIYTHLSCVWTTTLDFFFLFSIYLSSLYLIYYIIAVGSWMTPIRLRLYSYNQCVEWMSRQNSDKFVWCLNSKWCLWLNDCKYCKYEQSCITLNYKWSHWTSPNLVISTRNVHNVHSNVMFFFWCVYTLWDNWFIFSVVYYLKRNVWRSL